MHIQLAELTFNKLIALKLSEINRLNGKINMLNMLTYRL